MLPLGGLLIAVFVGWLMSKSSVDDELALKHRSLFEFWYKVLIRYVAPLGVIVVFMHAIGII
jgi:NSS family neurotransmitter:Na+ symporter